MITIVTVTVASVVLLKTVDLFAVDPKGRAVVIERAC